MRTIRLLTLGLLAVFTNHASGADSAATANLGWLSGHWCLESGGALIEELWLSPRGNLMLGVGRTVKGGKTVTFEFMRIESGADGTNYISQHDGAVPVTFRLTASGADWARFENPAHDFPKRVEYRRMPNGIQAEIAGPGKDGKDVVIPFLYRACN